MNRKKLAVLFGGCSSEYEVSLQSAFSVLENIGSKYEVITIGITKDGSWYRYKGDYINIKNNTWAENPEDIAPVTVSREKNCGGIIELCHDKCSFTPIDLAFPLLHGKNGEDGTIQGLFQIAGINVVGCNTLASALCMDKDKAHRLVASAGIAVPKSLSFSKEEFKKDKMTLFSKIFSMLSFPIFVKPVCSGSSFGISKVSSSSQLEQAIDTALTYDNRVILEENIDGFEVGCAVLGNSELIIGRADEIELSGGFFDFKEKYNLDTSKIHMPARIPAEKEKEIQKTSEKIYKTLGCSGFARVDMFLTANGDIIFNEVNTIPGFTSHSRYPNSLKGAGITFPEAIEKLLSLYD